MSAPFTFLIVQSTWFDRARSVVAVRRAGALALSASTPKQAQACLARHAIDIALLDLDAPDCAPYELLMHIQAACPSVYAVAMSASLQDSELERCFARGFDDFLAKPLRGDGLRALMAAAADARSAELASRTVSFADDADVYSPELQAQLLMHLRDETDKLYAVLSGSSFIRMQLSRKMHRIRSGLLLVGLRPLADECLDLERDCELDSVDEDILHRRGWKIARQMRALSSL
jgi:CheY-like chemotaxis protein